MKRIVLGLFLIGAFLSAAQGGTVYKWVDKDGRVNFTDDYTKIPVEYRNKIETQETPASQEKETPAPAPAPAPGPTQKAEERKKVDAFGRGEEYWRGRVQPWKKQLKEATENYESATRRMNEKLDQQSGKLLSPTQWNMNQAENKQVLEERTKCEAQIKEANEMLKKIAKEAEEAKADPEWLK